MRKTAALTVVAFILSSSIFHYSCSKTDKKTLTIVDLEKLDRASDFWLANRSLIGPLLFSPLLYKNLNKGTVHYVLAEDVRVEDGGRAIDVRIRDGVYYHDGTALTASHIVNSIERSRSDPYLSQRLRDITAEAADKLLLRLRSPGPVDDLNLLLGAVSALPPVPGEVMNGTGPFRFGRWLENGLELLPNDRYFEGPPGLKKIVYLYEPDERKRLSMMLKGDADLMTNVSPPLIPLLGSDPKFDLYRDPTGFYTALFLNTRSPLLDDPKVRKAISLSIDRKRLIDRGMKGGAVEISSPFPLDIMGGEARVEKGGYRPKEGVRLLREAGWVDRDGDGILEKGGRPLDLTLYYPSEQVDEFRNVIDMISQSLYEAGISTKTRATKYDDLEGGRLDHDYDMVLTSVSYIDNSNLERWVSGSEKGNISRYGNPSVDRLIAGLRETRSPVEREIIYREIADILDRDVPAVFLYVPVTFIGVRKGFAGSEGMDFSVYGFYGIREWE